MKEPPAVLPTLSASLDGALHFHSPRFTAPPTPAASLLIHGLVLLLWFLLLLQACIGAGLAGWAVGIVYIAYDTLLLAFTFVQTWPLRRTPVAPIPAALPHATVIIAAYNEAAVLEATIAALVGKPDRRR